jgi:hypothetical protein
MTTCTEPNRFAEWEFEAHLDGQASPEFAQHLQQCAHCAQKLEVLRAEASQLDALLARADCPDPDILLAYRWGQLGAGQARQVDEHVRLCKACAEELAQALGPLRATRPQTEPVAESTARSLISAIGRGLRLFSAIVLPSDRSALPALRGEAEPRVTSYRLEAAGVANANAEPLGDEGWELVLQTRPESTGYALSGQLLGPDTDVLERAHATLMHGEAFVTEASLDDTGWFEMRVSEPGQYLAVIELPERRILADVSIGVDSP